MILWGVAAGSPKVSDGRAGRDEPADDMPGPRPFLVKKKDPTAADPSLDLSCDLGEGESRARTRALMRRITSANVACGGHAGDADSMDYCVRVALRHSVRLGAHPGLPDAFGRGDVNLAPDALELLLLYQVSALAIIARASGVRLERVKLHGSLYHATERDPLLARVLVGTVRRWFPGVAIVALAGGRVVKLARESGVPILEEGFADRGYREDGSLVPRDQPGALVTDVAAIRQRLQDALAGKGIATPSGKRLPLRPQTWCFHSDTPGALHIARTLSLLGDPNYTRPQLDPVPPTPAPPARLRR